MEFVWRVAGKGWRWFVLWVFEGRREGLFGDALTGKKKGREYVLCKTYKLLGRVFRCGLFVWARIIGPRD